MAATTITNTPSQVLPFILQAPKDWEKYIEIKKTVMRKSGAWDQVDPERTGLNLRRPRRPTPGDIKRKETLARNLPRDVEDMEETTIADLQSDDEKFQ